MTHKPIGADDVTGELPAVVEDRIGDTIDTAVAAEATLREAADDDLQDQIDAIGASSVETVAGVSPVAGDVPAAGLKTALSLPANTVTDLGALDTRVDAIEATEATYGDIVTHDASEFTTDAELAAEAALARNADNLSSGTVADARIAGTIARDSEVSAAVAAEAALARNADNLTSGTVADARIAGTIARDSEVSAAVAAEAALRTAADDDLQDQIDAITGSDVETVAGVSPVAGDVPTAGLKTALSLPANTVTELGSLDTRVDAIEAAEATYGDIVTHDASEFTTDAELAAEATLARNADNLMSGTVADGRIPSTIARDSEVTAAVAAEAALARNADNLTSGTVADARIAATIARDSEVTAAVAAEATLARNADNLTSGTVADARIASTIARDSEVTAAVAAEAALARNGDNITSGTVADARIASTIARDSEVTAAVAAEATARDAAILAFKREQPNTVALLGASIAEMGGGVGAGIYDTPTTSPLTRTDGFLPWADISLGGRLNMVKNAGVGGETSAQILARVTQVTGLAAMPGYCILPDFASNDLLASTASATIITNAQAICDALQAKGITVVLCTVLPIAGSAAHVKRQEEVNRWVRSKVSSPGFVICDWAARWADPTTGGPKTGFDTGDNLHPTPLGAGAIGRVLAEALRPHLGGSIELASHNLDQLNINLNPMMVGSGGTASTGTSGSVATDWIALRGSGAGTMACSKVARDPIDGIGGEWQKLELAGGGGAFFFYSDVAAAGITGEKLQVELEFEEADFSGVTDFRITCDTLAGAAGLGLYQLSSSQLTTDISSGVVRSPETFVVPAGGPFTIRTLLYFVGTAGSVKVSRFRTRKVA